MTLRDYIRILRQNLILIIACLLVGIAVGASYGLLATPNYQASTKVHVMVRGSSSGVGELNQGNNFARQATQSYVHVVTTALVLDPVIASLDLDTTPSKLAKQITASAAANSVVITITANNTNPVLASQIANETATSLANAVTGQIEARGEEAISPVVIETLQAARVPASPVSPNLRLNLLIGAAAGLAIGLGLAALRTVLDTRIRNAEDLERAIKITMIGQIPVTTTPGERQLVVRTNPQGYQAEAFRTLRTNVQFLAVGGSPTVLTLTSSGQGEGKTTTISNLALALADSGAKVVLIDADMRRPRIAEVFNVEGAIGLSNILAGTASASDALQSWGANLFLLPAGAVPPNPAELLGSPAMGQLLSDFREVFDFILIDAPPVLPVTDAVVLSRVSDHVVVVAASGIARNQQVAATIEALQAVDAKISGTVLTRARASKSEISNSYYREAGAELSA